MRVEDHVLDTLGQTNRLILADLSSKSQDVLDRYLDNVPRVETHLLPKILFMLASTIQKSDSAS